MDRQWLIDVPLSLNAPRTVELAGGHFEAAPGPADFPRKAVVTLHESNSSRHRLEIRFVYFRGNEEQTVERIEADTTLKIGEVSGRLFEISLPGLEGLPNVRLQFDTSGSKKARPKSAARNAIHYQAMCALMPFLKSETESAMMTATG